MASNIPVIRQIAWFAMIAQFGIIVGLIYVFGLLGSASPFLYGALVYVFLSFALRNVVAGDHRRGMKLVKQEKYAEAIPSFERSVEFFTRNSWVDRFRFLTILSASKMSYREMGLCNLAFSYSQIGDAAKAVEYYERALKEYPDNGMAKAALKMIGAVNEGQ